jgi:hypothetical protein
MSGQQEPWGELDRFDQLDQRDSTLDLSGLISRLNNGSFSNGNNDRGNGVPDNGVGVGKVGVGNGGALNNSGGARNSGVGGIGDTVPYVRPPQPGANGHGAIAAYSAYAAQGSHAAPRHSRESVETTVRAAPPAPPEITAEPDAAVDDDAAEQADVSADRASSDARPRQAPSALAQPVTQPARPERLVPGSLADLRQRLERLPYGHPSSPYHGDGERKPPPYRLKHLELAPPAPSRMTQAHSQPLIVDDDPIAAPSPAPPASASAGGASSHGSQISGPPILTQDQERIADDAYDRFLAAEGRNIFGSYGSAGLTVVMRDLAASLEYGELAPDTEQNSLLEPDAFKARFAAMLARYPDRTAELLAHRIPGAISYSFIFDAERYSAGIWMVQDALAATGFQLLARRNDWNNPANRCVATMWHDPTSGLPFEVQFHTAASLEAQQLARSSASLISDPRIPPSEAANLRSGLAAAWAALPVPPGHGQISEYRRDGGSPPPGVAQPGGQPPGEVASA